MVTDAEGRFEIASIRPGNYPNGNLGLRPAHIHFIFSHPDTETLATQIYFAGDPYLAPNDGCSSCASDDRARIVTLSQPSIGEPSEVSAGSFDIALRRSP